MIRPAQSIETDQVIVTVVPDASAMSMMAADVVAETIRRKPDAAICLPTGSTPLGMFDVLASRAASGELDFSRVELYCLDEYVGVGRCDPNSLTGWLWSAFVTRVGIDPQRVRMLPTTEEHPAEAAAVFDRDLRHRGGLDLAVLGLGPNGHIGYNEPGSPLASRTRVVELTPESIRQAAAYWSDPVQVPNLAITLGVGTLLEADRIVLIVSGPAKAQILRRALEEPASSDVPASWLRHAGQRLQVIVDQDAAKELSLNVADSQW
jgi:glucosamine-6-phosphate deaminase